MAETAWSLSAYALAEPPPLSRAARPVRSAPPPQRARPRRRHRAIFISDTHLGTRGCKADLFADFLSRNCCDTLYLVGDIVDGWQFKRWRWSEAQSRCVAEVLRMIDDGCRVVYVPGNHDEFLRPYVGRSLAGVAVVREAIHVTAAGQRLLVIHGDQFDGVIGCAKWLALLGDRAYSLALRLNDGLHAVRRALGLPYWSLSASLKRAVKNAVEYVSRYEEIVARAAAERGVDGVVCGHIHHAEIRRIGEVLYLNDGDWVESCSALVEDASGNLEILRWATTAPSHEPALVSARSAAALIQA
ncbi:MAG TPA: UDP-2,3-diacylglucosamine diphosphatase [Rhizomicrobium sp.]|jgi:UDP-2,3-diacylglucosamine pyrophosphatase LpxH|nr:UDP-2,3-diacylglucosamine diphosphatase [Rhizomicrobium sp.]